MMLDTKHLLRLQAFAEGMDNAGDGGGGEGSYDDSGLANQDVEDDSLFGYEEERETPQSGQQKSTTEGTSDDDDYAKFREKYKDRIGEDIQSAIQKRFKNQESAKKDYNDLVDGLSPLFYRYGIDSTDVKGLLDALSNDDSLYEDMAYDKGMTPEAAREQMQSQAEIARMRREIEAYENEKAAAQANQDAIDTYNKWVAEAEELKQLYPTFDLGTELENEDFKNDLMNGKSMRKAYIAAHDDEIIQGAIQTAYNKGQEVYANNIRSRGMRPAENGTRTGTVNVKKDPKDLTDKEIDRILKRARSGEIITF